jgi:tungstate transport system substrate-binding protein
MWLRANLVLILALLGSAETSIAEDKSPVVRCAVIGGLLDTEFWPGLADRFERATGLQAEVAASGPKHVLMEAFELGQADLIVMHSGDAIINLVADGRGENPQPWARNDMVLVGPAADPAGIRGEKDAVAALRKIIESGNKLLLHSSNGAQEVLSELLAAGELELDPANTIVLPGDRHRQMLVRAQSEKAYTLVGRIPFLNGKVDPGNLKVVVQGDPRLRRPYLVVVASGKQDDPRLVAARRMASFLRESETQTWIAEFGRGKYDDQPLFFPVSVPK